LAWKLKDLALLADGARRKSIAATRKTSLHGSSAVAQGIAGRR
jgi:hypothetical protein